LDNYFIRLATLSKLCGAVRGHGNPKRFCISHLSHLHVALGSSVVTHLHPLCAQHGCAPQVDNNSTRVRILGLKRLPLTTERLLSQLPKMRAFVTHLEELPQLTAPLEQLVVLRLRSIPECDLTAAISMLPALRVLHITNYGSRRLHLGRANALEVLTIGSWRGRELQDISSLSNLRQLRFLYCEDLMCLPSDIGLLTRLRHFELDFTSFLMVLPAGICSLTDLRQLVLSRCNALQRLPSGIGRLENLVSLGLAGCGRLEELPAGISSLSSLRKLNLAECNRLVVLPESISCLQNLQHIWMRKCWSITGLPDTIGGLMNLQTLDLAESKNLSALPESIGDLCSLRVLDLCRCSSIAEVPSSVSKLTSLQLLNLSLCDGLVHERVPQSVFNMPHLTCHI